MATNGAHSSETILITGGSGLIGTRLCRELRSFKLVGLDVKPPDAEDEEVELFHITTDLTDDASLRHALQEVGEEHGKSLASVIHLAGHYDFSGEPSPLYEELTVEGTRRLLRELQSQRFDVEQFVFSSSLLVMRPSDEEESISEHSPTDAVWAYPQSKLRAEQVIREEQGEIPVVILRIAGVYDEQCNSLPISQQIARIYEKQMESYVFPGDRSHGQALVHLEDLADCVHQVVKRRGELSAKELFLIAEPDVMSYGELQEEIGMLLHGKEWPTIRIPKFVAKAGAYVQNAIAQEEEDKPFIKPWMIDLADDQYLVDIERARMKLDWHPQHRLRQTLPKMIDSLRSDPHAFYSLNKLPMPERMPG